MTFDDAHLDGDISGIVAGILAACGQSCVARLRSEDIFDEVVKPLVAKTDRIRIADPLKTRTDYTPTANVKQLSLIHI